MERENADHLTARKLVLPIEYFQFKEIGGIKHSQYKLRRSLRKYGFLSKLSSNNKNFDLINDRNFSFETLKNKNYMIGHWQEIRFAQENRMFLIESICKNPLLQEAFQAKVNDQNTLVHVRRGDYLKFNEDLPLYYYEKSMEYVKNKDKKFNFKIYTDDSTWCKKQRIFLNAEEILTSSDSPEDTIDTFGSMIKSKNFIIANSTFSLMAAFLGKKDDSIITYPEPWFKYRKYNKNIVDASWKMINLQ